MCFAGPEAYGFHALEVLQCMVERRRGGETGVKAVQYICGDAVWAARDARLWDGELAEAAVAAGAVEEGKNALLLVCRFFLSQKKVSSFLCQDGLGTDIIYGGQQLSEVAVFCYPSA